MRQNKSTLITTCAKYFCHITYLTLTQLNKQQYYELIYQPYHIEEFDNSVRNTTRYQVKTLTKAKYTDSFESEDELLY